MSSVTKINRRQALRFSATITAAAWAPADAMGPAAAAGRGYGTDPSMMQPVVTWPLTLDAEQLASLTALCDLALPAQGPHPAASDCGVPAFLDEWLSAPYPRMRQDRELILPALVELEQLARQQFGDGFARLQAAQQAALFDRLAAQEPQGRAFAVRLLNLIAGGYYTTAAGHADMGYVGNRPLRRFPPPAASVLQQIDAAVQALARNWPPR